MRKQYQFGHAKVELRFLDEMKIPENMGLFEIETQEVQKICELKFEENLNVIVETFLAANQDVKIITRKDMKILTAGEKECRVIFVGGAKNPYAVYIEESPRLTYVWVNPEIKEMLEIDTIFVSLLGLEKVMIHSDALILHCAYMCRNEKAVLFSAPSETGKSTQANLWEKYRGTRTVNGDKSLLLREEDGWYANGWPICGSSEICHNEAYPIQAIVMLYQSGENEVRRLGMPEAMKKLMAQITMNMWNSKFQIKAMDMIQQLIMEVPVYELGCNISEDAVKCLERVL